MRRLVNKRKLPKHTLNNILAMVMHAGRGTALPPIPQERMPYPLLIIAYKIHRIWRAISASEQQKFRPSERGTSETRAGAREEQLGALSGPVQSIKSNIKGGANGATVGPRGQGNGPGINQPLAWSSSVAIGQRYKGTIFLFRHATTTSCVSGISKQLFLHRKPLKPLALVSVCRFGNTNGLLLQSCTAARSLKLLNKLVKLHAGMSLQINISRFYRIHY